MAFDGTGLVGLHVAVLLVGRDLAAFVPNGPGILTGLAVHMQGLLGVTRVLVGKPLARLVDVKAAFGDRGPTEVNRVRGGHSAMALERAHVFDRGPQGRSPDHCIALVASVAFIEQIHGFGDVLAQHVFVAAKTVAGQDQHIAAHVLGLAIGPFDPHSVHPTIGIGKQVGHMGRGGNRDALALDRRHQHRQQLRAIAGGRGVHVRAAVARVLKVQHR